jgi:hypothetical protein
MSNISSGQIRALKTQFSINKYFNMPISMFTTLKDREKAMFDYTYQV